MHAYGDSGVVSCKAGGKKVQTTSCKPCRVLGRFPNVVFLWKYMLFWILSHGKLLWLSHETLNLVIVELFGLQKSSTLKADISRLRTGGLGRKLDLISPLAPGFCHVTCLMLMELVPSDKINICNSVQNLLGTSPIDSIPKIAHYNLKANGVLMGISHLRFCYPGGQVHKLVTAPTP